MKNVQMEVKGKNLIITVDLTQDHGPSKSGKTIVVASTLGNVNLPGEEFSHIKLGLNVYKYDQGLVLLVLKLRLSTISTEVTPMKGLVEFMAKAMVDNPQQVEVAEIAGEQTLVIELCASSNGCGQIRYEN